MSSNFEVSDINNEVYYIIYSNLYKLMQFRGIPNITPILSINDFYTHMDTNQSINIISPTTIGIFVVHTGTNFTATKLPNILGNTGKDLVIVYYLPRHINSIVSAARKMRVKSNINTVLYMRLMFDFSSHVSFVKHEICSEQMVKDWEKYERVSRSKLPIIKQTDPIAIWYGFKLGDIVVERIPTKNTGIAARLKQIAA